MLKNNLFNIIGDEWSAPSISSRSICEFDLFVLVKLAHRLGAKKITEFGCGATTIELTKEGFAIDTFSLDICQAVKQLGLTVGFTKCNLFDKTFLPQILESVASSDLLVIDNLHTFEMAKYYSENILSKCDVPVWIHDYWYGRCVYGEQKYLDEHVIGKTHKIVTLTDLPMRDVKDIGKKINHDISNQKHTGPFPKNTGPKMCSVILERQ